MSTYCWHFFKFFASYHFITNLESSVPDPKDSKADAAVKDFERVFAPTMQGVDDCMQVLDSFIAERELAPALGYAMRLAFEELATNVVKYAYVDCEPQPVEVTISLQTPVTMTLVDSGQPFNPLQDAPDPTLEGEIEDRPIGGLGLHIIQSMGMTLSYTRQDGQNQLHIRFPPAT
jgi:anti-sigma regulatory factor (Ser/Thr protein kinase)